MTVHKIRMEKRMTIFGVAITPLNAKMSKALFLVFFALAFLLSTQARALTVESVRVGLHQDKTRIVFDLSDVADFRAFVLQDPWRLVVDMPDFDWKDGKVSSPTGSGIKSVRHGALKPGYSRIVLDLNQTHIIKSAFHIKATEGKNPRLVVDIARASQNEYLAHKGKVFGKLNVEGSTAVDTRPVAKDVVKPENKPVAETPKQAPIRKRVVVLDAGHGGADPGAIGANGVFEKNVVLAIVKDLKKKLERTGRYDVRLTRGDDTFVRLYKRVEIARSHKADLFVSIHADTIQKSHVHGASIYTLSEKASDQQTARLAARENKADQIAGVDLSHEDKQVADILVDLVMRDTMNQSNFLANTVVSTMDSNGMTVLENPHRSAGFAVLKAPDIPSILIEVGFLSNRKEAERLSQPAYRSKVADSVKLGIDAYFDKLDRNQQY